MTARSKKSKSLAWKLGVFFVFCGIGWVKCQELNQGNIDSQITAANSHTSASSREGKGTSKGGFEYLNGCTLIKHGRNDGDSFHVKTPNGKFEFRLYYVDAPESAARRYRNGENNFKRIAQQGDALGGLSQKQTVELGVKAKHFVAELLRRKKFRVMTRWERVFGGERRYAFVVVEWRGRERYLHELLVERGLCRIYTKPMKLPDGASVKQQKRRLYSLERTAKRQRKGAWGM